MPCFVEFECEDSGRLTLLERVVAALVHAKDSDEWREDDYWLAFFDEEARSKFWWPTESEQADHLRRWFATPVETRLTDRSLETPWDFGSMIDAFRNGDYRLIGLRRLHPGAARIEYDPFGHPYGGTGCMVALVEAFGFRVSQIRD